ncbi:hypothetical protein [Streptomyces noursei]|uniref:EF-Tu C-terminal domain-related protein n=1 Tax=Streptomyces noursei TaxID=1971 RepID=UPI001678E2B8|nr:hypothetical protein [Streptomyces noursei]MCZ1013102.1 hypothetical protein [Streptomyces noursei]
MEHRQTLRPTAGVPKPSSRGKDLDSIDAYAAFTADITLLSEEQGSTDVVVGGRPCSSTRTAAVRGTVTVLHGTGVVRPLHGAGVTVALEEPVALEEGQAFAFRHHGRAAGSGIVTRLPH